jgi:UDP-glucose 4-epimerase
MDLKNKAVLVTGGAGFIGSHLVDRLVQENPSKIIIVDNFFLGKKSNLSNAEKQFSELKAYDQDASDYKKMEEIIKKHDVQVIFNLAVLPLPHSLEKPTENFNVNVGITMNLCELLKEKVFDTLIHCSSSEAYGTAQHIPMDENHPLNPSTPYAASKAACDHLVLAYHKNYGLDVAVVRPFNNYGPRQNEGSYAGVIPLTIKRILNRETPLIYGDGEQTRDYVYVTDTADALIDVYKTNSTRGKVLNIASGEEITIKSLVRTIADQLDYNGEIKHETDRPGDVRRFIADVSLAKDLIDFKQKVGFEEGIKKTIEWYKNVIK